MAEYKHGEMDIEVQEKTFAGFVKWVTTGAVCVIAFLIFLAIVNG